MSRMRCRTGVSQKYQAILNSRVRQEAGSGARLVVMHGRKPEAESGTRVIHR